MMMDEDAVRTYFSENLKLFDIHSYINFVTGFHLANKEFAKFLQPKQLCMRRFEVLLGSLHKGYDVPKYLLKKELEDRQILLHNFDTAHLMENYANKVGKVSEQERTINKVCPKSGLGITKRMLVTIKFDTIR